MDSVTRESQFNVLMTPNNARMGAMAAEAWERDPKHLLFTLARYKFVAKMLTGRGRVLEVGCGDAFASRIVRQAVGSLVATDFDQAMIGLARACQSRRWPIELVAHDPIEDGPVPPGGFDAAYALDVIEHIPVSLEYEWLGAVVGSLSTRAILVLGSPSRESQAHASEISRAGHVNCKSGPELTNLLRPWFPTVLSFSMNDEVVHTGFHGMAHYLFAVGVR